MTIINTNTNNTNIITGIWNHRAFIKSDFVEPLAASLANRNRVRLWNSRSQLIIIFLLPEFEPKQPSKNIHATASGCNKKTADFFPAWHSRDFSWLGLTETSATFHSLSRTQKMVLQNSRTWTSLSEIFACASRLSSVAEFRLMMSFRFAFFQIWCTRSPKGYHRIQADRAPISGPGSAIGWSPQIWTPAPMTNWRRHFHNTKFSLNWKTFLTWCEKCLGRLSLSYTTRQPKKNVSTFANSPSNIRQHVEVRMESYPFHAIVHHVHGF